MPNKPLCLAMAAVLLLSGCVSTPTYQTLGRVVGGALGGALGTQVGSGRVRTVAIIVGTLAGAAIGGSIGHSMDVVDRMRLTRALEHGPANHPSRWRNPNTGTEYTVTPRRAYHVGAQSRCRDYSLEARSGGRRDHIAGTACRQPDGSWQGQS